MRIMSTGLLGDGDCLNGFLNLKRSWTLLLISSRCIEVFKEIEFFIICFIVFDR